MASRIDWSVCLRYYVVLFLERPHWETTVWLVVEAVRSTCAEW